MPPTELAIATGDTAKTAGAFPEFTWNQRVILAESILHQIRTNQSVQEALNAVDADAELGMAGDEFLELHAEESLDNAIALVLALVSGLR